VPVTTEPSAEPTPQFRRLVRNSPTLRACQREIFACFEQALADETGAAPDAVEPFIAAAGLVSVFRVNLEGRDSDKEPPGAMHRTCPRPPRTQPRRVRRLAHPATCPAEQKCRICAHHGRTVTRQSAAPNGGYLEPSLSTPRLTRTSVALTCNRTTFTQ
jgi:hypothetical protein